MGWSKGKGLGANLDGQLDFIKVSHKGDQKGVGFKDRDDQWTSHESNFNNLLNSFKSTENSDEETQEVLVHGFKNDDKIPQNDKVEEKIELFSGVSLEEQSKKSRARVHYKKFTRGKDLSRYSEKDLANIFGKKSFQCSAEADRIAAERSYNENSSKENPNIGITTIETGMTINDYFKNKMKRSKSNNFVENASNEVREESVVEDVSLTKKEKKKKSKKLKSSELSRQNSEINETTADVEDQLPSGNKRKRDDDNGEVAHQPKRKKNEKTINQVNINDNESDRHLKQPLSTSKKSKKTRKVKDCDTTLAVDETSESPKTDTNIVGDCAADNGINIETVQPPRKSKSKRKHEASTNTDCSNHEFVEVQSSSKSKNKTSDTINGIDTEKVEPAKESKKKKEIKSCDTHDVLVTPTNQNSTSSIASSKKTEDPSEAITDNIYEIRRYRAEIFRYVDLRAFPGSTLCDIPGYGYSSDITLKIVDKGNENQLINTLWNDAVDKYANVDKKKKKKKFVEHIGDLKKKNIFQI